MQWAAGSLMLLACCLMQGCGDSVEEPEAQPTGTHTLQGTVLKKPATKSLESWVAGGSEYYVLDVGEAEVQRSAEEGVILRPGEAVDGEALETAVGKRVEVEGVYVESQPYVAENEVESFPMDPDGKPLPRGAGFQVSTLRVLD